jgi:8-oxo-dGTP diphosphatase
MTREYPLYPVIAVSAAVVNEHAVLLIRRGKEPASGQWAFPGGAVKLGESPEAAVIREVLEECNIEIVPQMVNRIFSHLIKDSSGKIRFHYIVVNYQCRMNGGTPRSGSDALEIRWIKWQELEGMDLADGVAEAVGLLFDKEEIS